MIRTMRQPVQCGRIRRQTTRGDNRPRNERQS